MIGPFHVDVPIIRGMQYDEEFIAYLVGWLKIEVADKLFGRVEQEEKSIDMTAS